MDQAEYAKDDIVHYKRESMVQNLKYYLRHKSLCFPFNKKCLKNI